LRNLSPLDLQIEISAAEMEANLVPLQDGSKSVISFETVHRRKDGSFYPVEVTVQYGASELQPVYFGQAIDLTQRRKAEADLVQAQRLQSVGQLTGGVAHDFNNMLQALQLNLELIPPAQEVDTDYRSAALHIIDRAAQLTQRLLAFSRKQNLSPKQTDVNKTLSRLAGLLRRTLGETIELELQLADNINVVLVDEVQLESSLLNLVLNARDAMPAGGRLVLSTFAGHFPAASNGIDNLPEGDYVRLSVTDVGEGMTPEVLKNAIEPFFTTKDVGQGTGLGLSMVYGFVKQSGGFFILESKPGEGTVVHLLFPALVVSLPEQDAVSSGNKPSLHGSETILLIEDEQVVRDITRKALSDLGYQVISAADGQQALDLVQGYDGPIHLILSDVILPGGLSGPITVARLNETQGPMATVFMSGYVDMPDPVGRDMLADHGFLQKPFRREQLAAAIRLALD
jgi:signal transduction histidine kinase/CheY-like chemotaxis protein